MKYFANLITSKLVVWNIIKSEDQELYAYGFWQGTILIANLITVVIIGLLCQISEYLFCFIQFLSHFCNT